MCVSEIPGVTNSGDVGGSLFEENPWDFSLGFVLLMPGVSRKTKMQLKC